MPQPKGKANQHPKDSPREPRISQQNIWAPQRAQDEANVWPPQKDAAV
jgi:hypothetical protein